MSTELIEKATRIIKSVEIPDRHSYFQIEKFMIGSQPTGQAQLWQIVRELKSRLESVESLMDDIENARDTVDELDVKIQLKQIEIREIGGMGVAKEARNGLGIDGGSNLPSDELLDLQKKQREIEIRRMERQRDSASKSMEKLQSKVKYILEEVNCLVAGFERITEKIGPMKPWDDPHAQKEMWNEKFLEEFNLRIILKRPLDTEFVKSIMSLDDDAPVKKHIVGLVERIQQQMIADQSRALAAQAAIAKQPQIEPKAKIQR